MDAIAGFFLSLGLLLLLTSMTLLAVQKPLRAILNELCGAEHRALFWTRFFSASLLLAMLFCALFGLPASEQSTMQLQDIAVLMRAGLFGVLAALGFLALVMLTWQSRFERGLAPPRFDAKKPASGPLSS